MSQEPPAPEVRSSFPAGARCAHHPERDAVRTCARCGNYLCGECSGSSSGVCLQCAARLGAAGGFPFDRDNYTLDGLLNLSLARWKQHWLALSVSTLLWLLAGYLPVLIAALIGRQLGPDIGDDGAVVSDGLALAWRGVVNVVSMVTNLACMLVLSGYWLDLLEGKRGDVAAALPRLRALPAQLAATLLIYFALALCAGCGGLAFWLCGGVDNLPQSAWAVIAFVVLLLPGLAYALTGITFVTFELADNPSTSAIIALRNSWQLADGKRWEIGGILTVSAAISAVGIFACCVGALASVPLGMLLSGALFLALKNQPRPGAGPVIEAWPV